MPEEIATISQNNTTQPIEDYVEILRQRFFIDHSSKAKTFITEEYTIISNHCNVTNIILQFPHFLPNLKVYDDKGDEITVMPNTYTRVLIESWAEVPSQDKEAINDLLAKMNRRETYIIWLKLSPDKVLNDGQTTILNFEYSAVKEKRKTRDITINIYPAPHSIFYVIKKPEDFDFGKRRIILHDENNKKHKINGWSKDKQDLLYVTETNDSISLTTKFEKNYRITLNYSFRPQYEIIALPTVAVILLISFTCYLWALQVCPEGSDCFKNLDPNQQLLIGKRLEFGTFIITSSLVLPRLIGNSVIRHRMLLAITIPILFSILIMLGVRPQFY